MADQWEVAGSSPAGTPASEWEVDKTEESGPARPGVSRPSVDMKTSALPILAKGAIQTVPGIVGTLGGGAAGVGAGPGGAIVGAGLGAAAGETASQAIEQKVFGDGVNPTSREGLKRTGLAGVMGAATEGLTRLHPVKAAMEAVPPSWIRAGKALIGHEATPAVGATEKLAVTPGELDPYVGRDPLTGDKVPVGAQSKTVVKPGFGTGDVRPGAKGRLLVTPGETVQPAEDVTHSMRGGTIVAPEPTRTLVGGEKTAFSLPKGAPLDRATMMGRESAADIKAVREGKPLIYTPKEGTGYPGARSESAPLVERRSTTRSALTTPTEVEKRLKTAPATARNIFDDTEGANATIAKDVDRLAGPKPGAGTKTEYSYKAGEGQPHEVVSKDASGKVTGKTMASGSGNELTVHFDGTNASSQGQGHALARLEAMAKQTGAKVLKSDISTTAGERAVWDKLQSRYPANVTKKSFADGQVQYTWNLKGGK